MRYTWHASCSFDMAGIPKAAAEQLKLAGALQLRVLLWLACVGGGEFDAAACALYCGASADLCEEAFEYWMQRGIVSCDGSVGEAMESSREVSSAKAKRTTSAAVTEALPVVALPAAAPTERELPSRLQVIERKECDERFSFLLEQAAVKLGRVLSPADMSLYLYLYRDVQLPPEVILMIIGYAVKNGKGKLSYIEKTAIGWAENGIVTLEAADAYLCRLERCQQAWEQVKEWCALSVERPTVSQKEAAYRWVFEWDMPREVVAFAVEFATQKTGKFQAAYTDRVLERLHGLHITTVAAAKEELTVQKKATKSSGARMKTADDRAPSFNTEEYEALARRRRPLPLKRED